ncbi:MAG: protein-glutamine glutaminase family protein, partial [Bdellovibrio sp.]
FMVAGLGSLVRALLFVGVGGLFWSAWALSPEALCGKKSYEGLLPWQSDQLREACSLAGQYEESLLPDEQVQNASPLREGRVDNTESALQLGDFLKSRESQTSCMSSSSFEASQHRISYPNVLLEKTATGTIPVSVVTEQEAKEIFAEISRDPRYAKEVLEAGCWARSHLIARALEKKGIRAAKVFIEGDLLVDQVRLTYHVAPVIAVSTSRGLELQVLDPTLGTAPLPISSWSQRFTSLEKNKKAEPYLTDRFVLQPLKSSTAAEQSEDPSRKKWHSAELVLAEKEMERHRLSLEK